jgi:F-type H+-transporting ATPase subunit beta
MANIGKINQVIGPVVDVKFEKDLPAIYNALEVELGASASLATSVKKLTLEVQQQLPGNIVRTIAMTSTDGLKRGMAASDTGAPISVPVGKVSLGRIFNVLGEAVDGEATPKADKKYPIHPQQQCDRRRRPRPSLF